VFLIFLLPAPAPAPHPADIAPRPHPSEAPGPEGAGLAEQPALLTGRTKPLLLLPPTASFRLPLPRPRRALTAPGRAPRPLRGGGRGSCRPLGQEPARGRGFPPTRRVFPAAASSFVRPLHPGSRGGKGGGGSGRPPGAPRSAALSRPRLPRGVRKEAVRGSAGAEGTERGTRGPTGFLRVCPANSHGGKSPGGFAAAAAAG